MGGKLDDQPEAMSGPKRKILFLGGCTLRLSGVLQGSVLGPLIFVVFINDIDEVVQQVDRINKFTDDMKIGTLISTI